MSKRVDAVATRTRNRRNTAARRPRSALLQVPTSRNVYRGCCRFGLRKNEPDVFPRAFARGIFLCRIKIPLSFAMYETILKMGKISKNITQISKRCVLLVCKVCVTLNTVQFKMGRKGMFHLPGMPKSQVRAVKKGDSNAGLFCGRQGNRLSPKTAAA